MQRELGMQNLEMHVNVQRTIGARDLAQLETLVSLTAITEARQDDTEVIEVPEDTTIFRSDDGQLQLPTLYQFARTEMHHKTASLSGELPPHVQHTELHGLAEKQCHVSLAIFILCAGQPENELFTQATPQTLYPTSAVVTRL